MPVFVFLPFFPRGYSRVSAARYPHRTASLKRLQALGEIVHSQSMLMPGTVHGRESVLSILRGGEGEEAC